MKKVGIIFLVLGAFMAIGIADTPKSESSPVRKEPRFRGIGFVCGASKGDTDPRMLLAEFKAKFKGEKLKFPEKVPNGPNPSLVLVTANIPDGAKPGSIHDVTVSALGDTPSLEGGILMITQLSDLQGVEHAVAQGAILKFNTKSKAVGEIPHGANVTKRIPPEKAVSDNALPPQSEPQK